MTLAPEEIAASWEFMTRDQLTREEYWYVCESIRMRLRDGWCQHHYAVDAYGTPVLPTDKKACAWCLRGALIALLVAADKEEYVTDAERDILFASGDDAYSFADLNDHVGARLEDLDAMLLRAQATFR